MQANLDSVLARSSSNSAKQKSQAGVHVDFSTKPSKEKSITKLQTKQLQNDLMWAVPATTNKGNNSVG